MIRTGSNPWADTDGGRYLNGKSKCLKISQVWRGATPTLKSMLYKCKYYLVSTMFSLTNKNVKNVDA